VEEVNLGWVHSGWSRGYDNIARGDGSYFGNGLNFVGFNNGDEFEDGVVGEDETEFTSKFIG